jgi:hypothetical protein
LTFIKIELNKNRMNNSKVGVMIAGLLLMSSASAQVSSRDQLLGQRNVITTAVPFLTITPDARAAGMGDVGVATTPDANSVHWNPGKLAFVEKNAGVSLSAAPWLRQLVPDVWFYYLSGYTKLGDRKRSALAASMRYFTLGDIQFTDDFGNNTGNYRPFEMALDVSYSSQLSKKFSLGVAMRYIVSDLAKGQTGTTGVEIRAGQSGAGDVGGYWHDKIKRSGGKEDIKYALGFAVTNIGAKITYTNEANRDFIPTNLRLGTSWNFPIDEHNEFTVAADVSKLLVPSQPVYFTNVNGGDSLDNDGNRVIQFGRDPNQPVLRGMFQSFNDAPGGFGEEMREWIYSLGVEYWYDKQFAVRAGYFHEADTKGGRQYAQFGIGLRYNVFGIDAAYLQPFAQRHPLQNTIRFTLMFDIDAFQTQNGDGAPN